MVTISTIVGLLIAALACAAGDVQSAQLSVLLCILIQLVAPRNSE